MNINIVQVKCARRYTLQRQQIGYWHLPLCIQVCLAMHPLVAQHKFFFGTYGRDPFLYLHQFQLLPLVWETLGVLPINCPLISSLTFGLDCLYEISILEILFLLDRMSLMDTIASKNSQFHIFLFRIRCPKASRIPLNFSTFFNLTFFLWARSPQSSLVALTIFSFPHAATMALKNVSSPFAFGSRFPKRVYQP